MDSSAQGERYARLFRKAGAHLAKGKVARALEVLKEGRALAERNGHLRMARMFAAEIERAGRVPDRDAGA
ncbi:MAG TPA: hypothetical protein VFB33_08885 [Candidatus Binataceae bacterium]|jgi:hypothetical protein|nr:hypothetical protein [Candidatus Binataceae bacterium]